jgi:hypothetical protein
LNASDCRPALPGLAIGKSGKDGINGNTDGANLFGVNISSTLSI